MTGKKRVRSISRNEDSGMIRGAWVPRAGSVTDAPLGFLLLGRDGAASSEYGVAVRKYSFNTNMLSETRTTWLFWKRKIGVDTRLTMFPASMLAVNGPILNGMEVYSVSDPRRATASKGDVAVRMHSDRQIGWGVKQFPEKFLAGDQTPFRKSQSAPAKV